MKEITLTNNFSVALVSDEDYDRVVQAGPWYADTQGHGGRVYAYRVIDGKKRYLHRFVLQYEGSLDTDHTDGNGLNCQRDNIVLKSRTWNNLNPNNRVRFDNSSGIKGVYWDSHYNGWKAEMKVKGRKFNLGVYSTITEAEAARKRAEERIKDGLPPKEAKTRGPTYVGVSLKNFSTARENES